MPPLENNKNNLYGTAIVTGETKSLCSMMNDHFGGLPTPRACRSVSLIRSILSIVGIVMQSRQVASYIHHSVLFNLSVLTIFISSDKTTYSASYGTTAVLRVHNYVLVRKHMPQDEHG